MSEWVNIFVEIVARVTEGFCLYLLFNGFGEKKWKSTVGNAAGMILAWVTVSKFISFVVFGDLAATFVKSIVSLILRAGAMWLMGVFVYHVERLTCLFIVMMFASSVYISGQIGYGVGLLLLYVLEQMAMRIDTMNDMRLISALINEIYLFRSMFAVILPYWSARFLVKHRQKEIHERSAKEVVYGMFPVIMGNFAAMTLYFIFFVINENGRFVISYENYMQIYVFVTAAFAAIWLAVLFSFKLQQEMIKMQEERLGRQVLENQILQMQNAMTEMERFYESMWEVRHDVYNQVEVLERLLRENPESVSKEIAPFFEDLQKNLSRTERKIHTGNAVSDAVISSKFHFAQKEIPEILLQAEDFILTDKVSVRAYDIGIILNNGLDNAIEACRRLRLSNPYGEAYIKIKSYWRQNMFFIEIENSFDGNILWDADGLPCSAKENRSLHGIGLRNIRRVAEKYKGGVDCIPREGKFVLVVMVGR